MADTNIEWATKVWNPTRGCSRVSEGCRNCYAERQAIRHAGPGGAYEGLVEISKQGPRWTGEVRLIEEKLGEPLDWKKPQRIFVNSMSDLFHERLKDDDIAAVFGVMAACPQHDFLVLTKRAQRMRDWFNWLSRDPSWTQQGPFERLRLFACAAGLDERLFVDDGSLLRRFEDLCWRESPHNEAADAPGPWPLPNVWLGVSVEDQATADERIPLLWDTPAAIRFVSYEPALGPVDMSAWLMNGSLAWVIIGGESGPRARPFDITWAYSMIEQCRAAGVAVFCKQFGANIRNAGHPWSWNQDPMDRKGGNPEQWPEWARVREFPAGRTA